MAGATVPSEHDAQTLVKVPAGNCQTSPRTPNVPIILAVAHRTGKGRDTMSHLRRRSTSLLTAGALALLALSGVEGQASSAAACPSAWTMQTAVNPGTTEN